MQRSNLHTMQPALSFRQLALIAGGSLLLMAVSAGFAFGFVYSDLLVAGDPQATIRRFSEHLPRFQAGLLAWMLILLLDLLVAWALFGYFRSTHIDLARITAWLRLLYSAMLAIAITDLARAGLLLRTPDPLTLAIDFQLGLQAFEQTWGLALMLFGLHLLGLGWLCLRSTQVPNLLGYLLLIAGVGYTFLEVTGVFLPGGAPWLTQTEQILVAPLALGELAFAGWLIFRGGR